MNVCDDGEPERLFDFSKNGQCLFEADAAPAAKRRPIGFVERRFEDQANAEARRDFFQGRRHLKSMRAAFHLTRPREHRDGSVIGKDHMTSANAGVRLQRFVFAHAVL